MLKNIKLHIELDEDKQQALEEQLAEHVTLVQKTNINAFQRHIPSLLPYIRSNGNQNISIVCTKFGKFNIVDFGLGRVLYGFDPLAEVIMQAENFITHSTFVNFSDGEQIIEACEQTYCDSSGLSFDNISALKQYKANCPLEHEVELLVVLGLGLGEHVRILLEKRSIKHLIIYEPEIQYFTCSVMVTPWSEILALAKEKGTTLYFQLGKDGRDLIADIKEFQSHYDVSGFYLYQHYYTPIFNSIAKGLSAQNWSKVLEQGLSFSLSETYEDYCPKWCSPANLLTYSSVKKGDLFESNLQAFQSYFPDIYHEFKDYSPSKWLPVLTKYQQVNIVKIDNLVSWYSEQPKEDCYKNFDSYALQPNKDGLVLGYTGEKLKHYIHYQFVNETQAIFEDIEEEQGALPSTIKSIIIFGLGVGYQLEKLVECHDIERLFICEPNRDFFYASLFAIDWRHILKTIDEKNYRVYINIGDDGTNLFRDLLNQFYSIGPYILNNTFFYQSYYNSSLNSAIAQLREQLQVVISMGEYFDHAYFGINHTLKGLERGYAHLIKDPSRFLDYDDHEVPIFFIGNGPSLDYSLSAIKEYRDKAIVVSCGTSLQVLYKNNVVPDFHAEIEQNRSTYEWAVRLGDLEYLKKITLISCNGIHPDTCELYKDVLVAFKEGESSTVANCRVLGEGNFETLKFAFPTVSNFAVNLFKVIGFKQLYLFGVDLGFVDGEHHHSKESGYYDNAGMPLYDYSKSNNTALVVPGNFRAVVNTKHEFKVSKMVMEDALRDFKGACYNTSDGAKIGHTLALNVENILTTSTASMKKQTVSKLLTRVFVKTDTEGARGHGTKFEHVYKKENLRLDLTNLVELLDEEVDTEEAAESIIEKQKEILFDSYSSGSSLLFYLLYGTINYANAFMLKLLSGNVTNRLSNFSKAKNIWLRYLRQIESRVLDEVKYFDVTASFIYLREQAMLKNAQLDVLLVCDSAKIVDSFKAVAQDSGLPIKFTSTSVDLYQSRNETEGDRDFIIWANCKPPTEDAAVFNNKMTVIDFNDAPPFSYDAKHYTHLNFKSDFLSDGASSNANVMHAAYILFVAAGMDGKVKNLFPKLAVSDASQIERYVDIDEISEQTLYDFGRFIVSTRGCLSNEQMTTISGARAIKLSKPYKVTDFISQIQSQEQHTDAVNNMIDRYPFLVEK